MTAQSGVAREQRDALADCLSQQEAVERVPVQSRQAVDADGVLAGDGQFGVAIIEQCPSQQARLDAEVLSPESAF